MSKWDNMDKKVWESSPVMKELEEIYKKSNTTQNIANFTRAIKELGMALSSAADGKIEEMKSEEKPKKPKKLKKKTKKNLAGVPKKLKGKKVSKAEVISELSKISSEAIDNMDYKLAYEVEKTIISLDNDKE